MSRFPFVLALGLLAAGRAHAMDLAVAGDYSLPVSAVDLTAGAGSPLPTTETSSPGEVTLDIAFTAGTTDAWRVDVRRIDGAWSPDLHVWVRRTGEGSGGGSLSGGTDWQEVGPTLSTFFSGLGDRTSTPVQVRVTGLSLALAPGALATTLQYTLVDTAD